MVPDGRTSTGTRRILLLEDDYANRRLLTDYLEHYAYTVLSLPDGLHFLDHLETFHPHLLLLDLKLPGVDGFSILQMLQTNLQWSRLPVIVVSGYAFQTDQQRALKLGARRYLVKPVQLPELRRAIEDEIQALPET